MSDVLKPIQCKAAVCWKAGEPFVIETVIVDRPKDNEVRFKVVATGICSSDITFQNGKSPFAKFPIVAGHESTAIVESVGQDVKSLEIGDAVIPLWGLFCGKCQSCLTGTRNFCDAVMSNSFFGIYFDGKTRITCKDQSIFQPMLVASFSEYGILPEGSFVKIPNASLDKLCIYACCVPTGYGAAKFTAKVRPGSTVVIYGLGAVGLCVAMGCRDCGASKIIGIDVAKEKEAIGKKFGCTDFINPSDHPDKPTNILIKEATDGVGVDYAFVCVGKISVIEDAISAARLNCGEIINVGIPESGEFSVNPLHLILGKTLKGSWFGDCTAKHISELVDMYLNGSLDTDPLITHVLPLDQINEGFDMLRKTKSIRTVIKF